MKCIETKNKAAPSKKIMLALVVAFALISVFFTKIVLVVTPSIHPTILWKVEGVPAKRDYVTFKLKHEFIHDSEFQITKKIGCYQGEDLKIVDKVFFFCEGALIGRAKTKAVDGRILPLFNWEGGEIPQGKAFLLGTHPDSFDSRYWGFIDLNKVQRLQEII